MKQFLLFLNGLGPNFTGCFKPIFHRISIINDNIPCGPSIMDHPATCRKPTKNLCGGFPEVHRGLLIIHHWWTTLSKKTIFGAAGKSFGPSYFLTALIKITIHLCKQLATQDPKITTFNHCECKKLSFCEFPLVWQLLFFS